MKEMYWRYMVQIKAWQFYLEAYTERAYRWDRGINVFVAVVSSTSIAGWAIWNQFSYVWGVLIAVMQVLTAIKSFLPFGQRLQTLPALQGAIASVYNKIEYNWYQVYSGTAADETINQMIYEFRSQLSEIESSHMKDLILPERSDIKKNADKRAETYFSGFFGNVKQDAMLRAGTKENYMPLPLSSKLPATQANPKIPL